MIQPGFMMEKVKYILYCMFIQNALRVETMDVKVGKHWKFSINRNKYIRNCTALIKGVLK